MSELSLLIRGAEVIDGSGRPAVRADVGVRDGRIAFIGAGVGPGLRARGRSRRGRRSMPTA